MPDTKVSALADIVTLAAGDKVPVADASDLTASKSATMTEINTYLQTLPLAPAQISTLSAASTAAVANEFAINEAGTAKKVTGTQLRSFVHVHPYARGTFTVIDGHYSIMGQRLELTTSQQCLVEGTGALIIIG